MVTLKSAFKMILILSPMLLIEACQTTKKKKRGHRARSFSQLQVQGQSVAPRAKGANPKASQVSRKVVIRDEFEMEDYSLD